MMPLYWLWHTTMNY